MRYVITAVFCVCLRAFAGSELVPGSTMYQGQEITSPDGYFRLVLQQDGNLVAYRVGNSVRWVANASGAVRGVMQSDGNFVLYNSVGAPVWQTGTARSPGARLVMQSDGNLVIYRPDFQAVWDIGPDPAFYASPPRTLDPGSSLQIGTSIHSAGKTYLLAMQPDGNLVYYRVDGSVPVWNSRTGSGARTTMERNGNFAVFDAAGNRLWQSNSGGFDGAWLTAQDDGNLVVYDYSPNGHLRSRWDSINHPEGHPAGGTTDSAQKPQSGLDAETGKHRMMSARPRGVAPARTPTPAPHVCLSPCIW